MNSDIDKLTLLYKRADLRERFRKNFVEKIGDVKEGYSIFLKAIDTVENDKFYVSDNFYWKLEAILDFRVADTLQRVRAEIQSRLREGSMV